MQQWHARDKATRSPMPYHAKGKAAVINHGKDEAATSAVRPEAADREAAQHCAHHGHGDVAAPRGGEGGLWGEDGWASRERGRGCGRRRLRPAGRAAAAMNPKHVFPDENIVQDHLLPPHRIRQRGLNRDTFVTPLLRPKEKEMPDTHSSCLVLRKVFAKERSPPGMGSHGDMLHKPMDKVDTASILHKHSAQGINPPVKTESPLAREMSQKQTDKVDTGSTPQKHSTKEKTCPPDQLRRHTLGIDRPVKTEARMPQKRRDKVDTGSIPHKHNAIEKTPPSDQLRRHTHGIQWPVKTEARLAIAGEKKHTKTNSTSFQTKRTTPKLGTRTSSNPGTSSRPVDAHDRGNTAAIQEQKEEPAAIKVVETLDDILQKLNKLGLGEDISFEEFKGCMEQLPPDRRVDTSNELNLTDRYHMDLRHAVYRIRSFKLLKKESKNELCSDELKGCPMDLLDKDEFTTDFLSKMKYFWFFEKKGVLDWYFHSDLCKLADLNDYQRLVPRDYGNGEYAFWGAYSSYFHSYKMQHEYIEYFETLLRELEWLKDCLPRKFSSVTVNNIRTRGIYQATKIATRFSNMTTHLARIGFDDCFSYMSFEATWCNGSDDLYFEIWKRVTQQKESFKDTLKEVYKLNKCPSLQDSVKYAIDDDCTVMKCAFLRCTAGAGITKEVPVDKAQEMIAEAVKKLRIKPKFYDGYIRKKIEIAQTIGLITED